MFAGVEIIRGQQIREVWRTSLSSRTVLALTFGATLVLPIQIAVLFGVIASIVLQIYKTSLDIQVVAFAVSDDGSVRERTPPAILPSDHVAVLDFYGSAFFASAPTLQSLLPEAKEAKRAVVILRLRGRHELGSTFLKVLGRYTRELQSNGGKLVLTGVSDALNEQLGRSKYWELFGAENVFLARNELGSSTLEAVKRANEWLERSGWRYASPVACGCFATTNAAFQTNHFLGETACQQRNYSSSAISAVFNQHRVRCAQAAAAPLLQKSTARLQKYLSSRVLCFAGGPSSAQQMTQPPKRRRPQNRPS